LSQIPVFRYCRNIKIKHHFKRSHIITSNLIAAVESLCRRDATLLSADATFVFMMNKLGSTQLSNDFKVTLSKRIIERRTSFSSLLQYLHKGQQKFKDNPDELEFKQLSKSNIVQLILSLVERLTLSK